MLSFTVAGYGAEQPNVALIMVDNMGFSDLGYQGGEIHTPNLDALAYEGVRFSQFDNSGRYCPTRATLMTGLHPHQTGIGHMTESPSGGGDKSGQADSPEIRSPLTVRSSFRLRASVHDQSRKWQFANRSLDTSECVIEMMTSGP